MLLHRTPGRRRRRAGLASLVILVALACGSAEEPEDRAPGPAAAPAESESVAAEPARPRALWVLAEGHERVLENPEKIPRLLDDALALRATDLFVQVYRGGRAWYDSDRADAAPFLAAREAHDLDALAELLARAHGAGLRIHAWVNVLSLNRNRQAPILRALGDGAILVDKQGRSLLDYPDYEVPQPDRRFYRMGTPGLYLDPAFPGIAEHLAGIFSELLARYPELDGLHLDYIRYPDVLPFVPGSRFGVGLDFGYGQATRARFTAETGFQPPFRDSTVHANAWDAWRRDKLTGLVQTIGNEARRVHPGVTLSAAVWTYADRAYLAMGQDWRRWLEDESIDLAVPMSYTRDDRLLRYQAESFAGLPQSPRIWIGLGTWLFAKAPARAVSQIHDVRTAGAAGDALFSWDSIVQTPALLEALVAEAARGR